MKKKILFVIPEYSHGGTNKSLENLLTLIDHTKYDISIYCLYEDGGPYYKNIFAPYIIKKSLLYYWLHDNYFTRKFMGLYNKLTKRDNFSFLYKREAQNIQIKHAFNIVIAYQEGKATEFISYIHNCEKKIAWYHCPYLTFNSEDREKFVLQYNSYSKIVCVSNTFSDRMKSIFPEISAKFKSIYNSIDSKRIIDKSNMEISEPFFDSSVFTILSVGRFAMKSQFHLIPKIARELKKSLPFNSFRWFIIASGNECAKITNSNIEQYALQKDVILLGSKDNPYPYMKRANLVVCTSESESFSYVIAEAKALHTPVLSNDFPVAYEVLDERFGWIANINDMPRLLARIINNVDGEYSRKKATANNYETSNETILQQIDSLLSDNA